MLGRTYAGFNYLLFHSDIHLQVTGVILYIHPLVKSISMSLLPHLVAYGGIPKVMLNNVKPGEIIEDAVVASVDKAGGVTLKKDNTCLFAHVSRSPFVTPLLITEYLLQTRLNLKLNQCYFTVHVVYITVCYVLFIVGEELRRNICRIKGSYTKVANLKIL